MTDREKSQGNLRDEQTKAAVEQAEKAEAKRDRESTADKHRRLRGEATAGRYGRDGDEAEGREGEAPEDLYEPGPDGCIHLMQEQMIADAETEPFTVDDPERGPPGGSRVVHVMESQMKGEAIGDYVDSQPGPDNTLPEEPLPGKPPEPPLGGSRKGDERQPEPVQYPAGKQRR